ncbi:MBL fold hydrolase [Xenorhabdus szentirmaii DSM 16338]|nr:MBL fold hydrolase [Xenorhabdus szentirmaii DSM 16338]
MKNIFKVSHFAITLAITTALTTTIPASFAKPTNQPIIRPTGFNIRN